MDDSQKKEKKKKVCLTCFPVKNSKTIYLSVSCQVALPFIFFENYSIPAYFVLLHWQIYLLVLSINKIKTICLKWIYLCIWFFSILLECKTKITFFGGGGGYCLQWKANILKTVVNFFKVVMSLKRLVEEIFEDRWHRW